MQCASHPGAVAARECTRCGRLLCDGCVKRIRAGQGEIEACVGCGGLVRVAFVTVPSSGDDLRDLLARVFSRDGLLTALAIALPGALRGLGGLAGRMFGVIYLAGVASYYFLIVDHVGRARDGLPGASDRVADWGDTVAMAVRGIACVACGLLPLAVWIALAVQRGDTPDLDGARLPLTVGLLLAVGQIYMPAAILAVVITNHTLAAFWPIAWAKIIARAPTAYAGLVARYLVVLVAWFVVDLAARLTVARLPLVGGLLAATASNLVLFAQAALLGGFLRRHADDYGY